ncbi:hypothetical protein PInf_014090 [Phytophthora infestans]|nr:hypothetical protein PInf_014090 [Phytophthora infestans]
MSSEQQNDWDLWVKFAVYAYNSAPHRTVRLTPNELMMDLTAYHVRLVEAMRRSHVCAEEARQKEQERQARYYSRKGPMRIVEPTGYENFVLRREDKTGTPETMIAHSSFLVSYYYPTAGLEKAAQDIDDEVLYEEQVYDEVEDGGAGDNDEETGAPVRLEEIRRREAEEWAQKGRPSVRVASWWSYDDGEDGIELGNTSWSTNSAVATASEGRSGMLSDDGCRPRKQRTNSVVMSAERETVAATGYRVPSSRPDETNAIKRALDQTNASKQLDPCVECELD